MVGSISMAVAYSERLLSMYMYLLDEPQLLASRRRRREPGDAREPHTPNEAHCLRTRGYSDQLPASSSSLHSLMELASRTTTVRTLKVRDRRVEPPSHRTNLTTFTSYVIAVLPSLQLQILQLPKTMPIGIAFLEMPSRRWAEDMLSVALVSKTLCELDGILDDDTTTRLSLCAHRLERFVLEKFPPKYQIGYAFSLDYWWQLTPNNKLERISFRWRCIRG